MAEDTLRDSEAMRSFAGIELVNNRIPDKTTILNFRHLLERHVLTGAIFGNVHALLTNNTTALISTCCLQPDSE